MGRGRVYVGSKEMQAAIQKYSDDLHDEVRRIVTETAQLIVSTAKSLVPVDDGALRDSIEMELLNGGMKARVQVTAEYAIYVEYGTGIYAEGPGGSRAKKIPWTYYSEKLQKFITTSGMKAQPYWEPAIDAGKKFWSTEIGRLG